MNLGKCKSLSNITLGEEKSTDDAIIEVYPVFSKLAKKSTSPSKLYMGFDRAENLAEKKLIKPLNLNCIYTNALNAAAESKTPTNGRLKRSNSHATSTGGAKKCKLEPRYKLNDGQLSDESDTTETSCADSDDVEICEVHNGDADMAAVKAEQTETNQTTTTTAKKSRRKSSTITHLNGDSKTTNGCELTTAQAFNDQTI